ncbi:MAG: hypothetical protein AAF391_09135 [Bacteroidota bacterium]
MKKSKFIIAGVWVALISILWSCDQNDETTPNLQDQNFITDNILIGSNSALSRIRSTGFSGPIGALYGGYTSSLAGGRVSAKPSDLFSRSLRGRSNGTSQDTPDCMVETWTDDGEGNYTYSIDFGDGCFYYDYWMFGKMEEQGTYTDNSFSSSVTYTNFGGGFDEGEEDWSIDGTSSYSGTWEEIETDENNGNDSTWNYTSSYEFEADLITKYVEYDWSDEDSTQNPTPGETVIMDYEANGSEEMDNDGYTVLSRSEKTELNSGDTFSSTVDTPLFLDYSCDNAWVFVSGVESGSYTFEGASGTYSIDYGDGTCDNIITVTENGVTEDIDLGEEWDEWEEECGDDHG